MGREFKDLGVHRPFVQHHADNLRDDVPCPLQDDRITDPDVLAGDLVAIVQGGVDHHHAANGHGLQPRHRGDGARPAHLEVYGLKPGPGLLGGKFAGDGPAGGPGHETQPLLPVQPVDLVDHPVNVEGELGPQSLHSGIGLKQALEAKNPLGLGRGLESPGLQKRQGLCLGLGEGR